MASVLNLSKRIEEIVELCPEGRTVADIGCDHGYVAAELILEDKVDNVIATEISEQCLNKAVLLASSINISPFISFRQGDGFDAITKYDKLDYAVIAGMGGMEIINILENRPRKLYDFILQPMSETLALRQYLIEHKFKIEVDKIVKDDGKFYDLLKVSKGKEKMSDIELFFGKTNFTENYEVFYEYLVDRLEKLQSFQTKAGQLSNKLETELAFVREALSLYDNLK